MSQIWYYLLVSMVISGLCHSAVLKTDFTDEYQIGEEITDIDVVIQKNSHTGNDGSLQILGEKSTKEKHGRSKANTPKHDEECFPSDEDDECYYSVRFGERIDGDGMVQDETYDKPYVRHTSYTFTMKYPRSNYKINERPPISCITVEDPEDGTNDRIFNDDIVITQGGINHPYVTFNVSTENSYAVKYRVVIFVK